MKRFAIAAACATALGAGTLPAAAEPETYVLDSGHSQVLFSYQHLGFSTTWGIFSGWEGEISFDPDEPEASTVEVSIPTREMFTGWEARYTHFMTDDFFGAEENEMISFASTGIEVTGDSTALITGDLTVNGITKPVVLEAELTQAGTHPMEDKPWLGFHATTTLKRSGFGMGAYAPAVSDDVNVEISIEAMQVDDSES
ncbi:Protein yceI precursor [Rhodovulum sp. P5]|uniref:YceI family protein n=1 Tax=Rhodovulum sp. P5 TaxID=1564506 RepID=UPI0009C24A2E|nr:YceI family protein [Rhodovulum sp. P5]ARE38470.1 Protein yceI precursor [Rhodovulum sp. P5]